MKLRVTLLEMFDKSSARSDRMHAVPGNAGAEGKVKQGTFALKTTDQGYIRIGTGHTGKTREIRRWLHEEVVSPAGFEPALFASVLSLCKFNRL